MNMHIKLMNTLVNWLTEKLHLDLVSVSRNILFSFSVHSL